MLALLDDYGSPATVASAGGRYFGFVTGGSLPAALAANWLAGAWDQNAGLWVQSPVAAFLEEVAAGWLRDVFRLPATCGVGFVTGATMANFSCLAAARDALLKRTGWNVEDQGLFGAPEIRVIVGGEAHASLPKALSLVGLGRNRVTTIPADEQGRMRADGLPKVDDRTLVCMQAGDVNRWMIELSSACKPETSILGHSIPRGRFVFAPEKGAHGYMSTALLACGRRPHRDELICRTE